MSTLPKTGATELVENQASPETAVNEMGRHLDSGFTRAIIEDRDLAAPPGTCSDGACYLIASSPTGLWSGQTGKLAKAVGTNASNGWLFSTVAVEGFRLYIKDENLEIEHNGSAWATPSLSNVTPAVIAEKYGLPAIPFLILGTIAGAALVYLCRDKEPLEKATAIGAGSLLAAPYALSYDLIVIMPLFAALVMRGRFVGLLGVAPVFPLLPIGLASYALLRPNGLTPPVQLHPGPRDEVLRVDIKKLNACDGRRT